ncbi:MAG: glycoside hydrolase family 2 protein [Anaerolineae bacterium]|nr:glycoside hydrolase family 2 protein [Anaerolineae bacterium]MDW8171966.1 glycoside hydrolase family 2 TIM barrel-domain containing protein [Anaerolineae bacterium]
MRAIFPFNDSWLYAPQVLASDVADSAFEVVTLPHSNKRFPYHNFDDREYQFISTYRKRFVLPEARQGRRVFVDFDGVMLAATVSINGHAFPEHRGGFTPFSLDITDYLREGENLLSVSVDSRERADIPPFGHTVDYLVFGGIYRDVRLRYVDPVYIERAYATPLDVLSKSLRLRLTAHLVNTQAQEVTVSLAAMFDVDENNSVGDSVDVAIPAHGKAEVSIELDDLSDGGAHPQPALWTLDDPRLYTATFSLDWGDATDAYDRVQVRFGFRHAQFKDDGFYLNGQRLQLRGLNRHQTFPYIGAAAPARLQRRDADIVKYELGCNIVRTSHYPQSPHFLNRCDEIGLLVFEEIPGWQHIGDADWKALSLRDVRAMIERDYNHPAIIMWGVRINESWDDHDFYEQTNALARQLDPTRPTGGVRFFQGSEFLEDVYTLNDFSNDIQEPQVTPHLVTEFNGHMFPTKTWDNEERRVEHARRHARIQARAASSGGVSGAIGWCAFDYNTHEEFGAGDRICYHGVMDIWRLPKFAAFFYESQQDAAQRVVLRVASNWRLGDVSEGLIEPVYVFSNCEEVVAYVGGRKKGTFRPAHDLFPGLPHPPFRLHGLDALLAHPYGDLRVVGLIGGQEVAEQIISAPQPPKQLILRADDDALLADGADMTRVAFLVADAYGNPLPYAVKVVTLTLDGPQGAELIGDNPFPLVGGQAALYLRAGHTSGVAVVRAQADRLPPAEIRVRIG